jgi:hypothetical protein
MLLLARDQCLMEHFLDDLPDIHHRDSQVQDWYNSNGMVMPERTTNIYEIKQTVIFM